MTRVSFTIPGEPVSWKRARRGQGHSYTDPKAAEQMERVRAAARQAGWRKALAVPFRLTCRFFRDMDPTDGRFGDEDNLRKLLKDALNGVIWVDDRYVTRVGEGGKFQGEPRTEVTVEVVAEAPDIGVAVLERPRPAAPARAKRLAGSARAENALKLLLAKKPQERELSVRRRLRPAVRRPT